LSLRYSQYISPLKLAIHHVPLSAISHGTCPLATDRPFVVGGHGATKSTSARDVGTDIVVQNTVVEDFVVVLSEGQYNTIDEGV
jgi:hypothetical protein